MSTLKTLEFNHPNSNMLSKQWIFPIKYQIIELMVFAKSFTYNL